MKYLPQPNEKELKALLMLRNADGFDVVMDYLGRCADLLDHDNRWTVDEVHMRHIQGRTQAIEDLAEILAHGELMLVDMKISQSKEQAAGAVIS